MYVFAGICLLIFKTRERETGNVEDRGTRVERAPGQKVEVQSAKMTALEYESRASGTLAT